MLCVLHVGCMHRAAVIEVIRYRKDVYRLRVRVTNGAVVSWQLNLPVRYSVLFQLSR